MCLQTYKKIYTHIIQFQIVRTHSFNNFSLYFLKPRQFMYHIIPFAFLFPKTVFIYRLY